MPVLSTPGRIEQLPAKIKLPNLVDDAGLITHVGRKRRTISYKSLECTRAATTRSNRAQVAPQISFTNQLGRRFPFPGNDDLPRMKPYRFGTVTERSGDDNRIARRPPLTVSIAQFRPIPLADSSMFSVQP
jgi:hypothetical protein